MDTVLIRHEDRRLPDLSVNSVVSVPRSDVSECNRAGWLGVGRNVDTKKSSPDFFWGIIHMT